MANFSIEFEFDTSEFVASHGKEPRAYGSWAFEFPWSKGPEFAPPSTYAAAKKWARGVVAERAKAAEAEGFHHVVVNVCP